MIAKRKNIGPKGLGKSAAAGSVVSVIVSLLISMVITTMLNNEKMTDIEMGYAVMVMLLLASYSGAYTACKIRKEQRLISSLLTGAMYFVILAGITILLFEGRFSAAGESALLIVCGSLLAAMWTSRRIRGNKGRKFKFSNG